MKYRSLIRVHIGGTDEYLDADEEFMFDGKQIIREGGGVLALKTPGSITAAINIGWIVLADSGTTTVPKRASGVQVYAAQSTGAKRAPSSMATVQRDEQVIGNLNDVRGANAPQAHRALDASKTLGRTELGRMAPTGAVVAPEGMFNTKLSVGGKPSKLGGLKMEVVQEGTGAEETVVPTRKFSTTAKGTPVTLGVNDAQEIRRLNTMTRPANVAPRVVEPDPEKDALVGGELEDVLPGVVSSGKPRPGLYREGAVVTGGGDQDFSTAREGKVLGGVGDAHAASLRTASAQQKQVSAENAMAAALAEVAGEAIDLAPADTSAEDYAAALEKTRLEVVKHLVPEGFKWDMSGHWMARAKLAVDLYRDFPAILMAIMAMEVASVQAEIMKRMYPPKPPPANAAIQRDPTAVE